MTAYQRTESEKRFRMTKSYRLIINDDGGRGLWNWVGPLSAEQYQDAVCVQVAGKPVDALFWCGLQNPSGSARYNTKVGEVHGTRHGTRMTHASQWMALNTKSGTLHSLISQGHDPLTLVCDRCHELGVDAWLSMRFNDAHGRWGDDGGGSFKTTQLYLDRPDLRIGADNGWPVEWAERLWDYTKQPVRDNVYALLKEAYMDYDVDGVELDFMRCIYCFPRPKVDEGRECLNGLIAQLRALADRAAEKKGRPQGLAVKIPSYEPACGEIGLDWRTWVDNGWVDVLTASDYHPAEQEADMGISSRAAGTAEHWYIGISLLVPDSPTLSIVIRCTTEESPPGPPRSTTGQWHWVPMNRRLTGCTSSTYTLALNVTPRIQTWLSLMNSTIRTCCASGTRHILSAGTSQTLPTNVSSSVRPLVRCLVP